MSRDEDSTIGKGPAPSVSFLPLFEIGRIPGKWYVSFGDTIVHGETIGIVVGTVTDWLQAVNSRLLLAEIAGAKRKDHGENDSPGAQAKEILAAMQDATADMSDEKENEEPDRSATEAALDHFLDHPAGQQAIRRLKELYHDSDPTTGTENAYRGDRSKEFYEGMLNGLCAALGAKLMVARQLSGKADTRALDVLQALLGQFAAGALARTKERTSDGEQS